MTTDQTKESSNKHACMDGGTLSEDRHWWWLNLWGKEQEIEFTERDRISGAGAIWNRRKASGWKGGLMKIETGEGVGFRDLNHYILDSNSNRIPEINLSTLIHSTLFCQEPQNDAVLSNYLTMNFFSRMHEIIKKSYFWFDL